MPISGLNAFHYRWQLPLKFRFLLCSSDSCSTESCKYSVSKEHPDESIEIAHMHVIDYLQLADCLTNVTFIGKALLQITDDAIVMQSFGTGTKSLFVIALLFELLQIIPA